MGKWTNFFSQGIQPTTPLDNTLLGNKGKCLGEMCSMNLPVPSGFTIFTTAFPKMYSDKKAEKEIKDEIENSLQMIEKSTGKAYGDPHNPLLLSVRSGASVSMPGMMDTILNIGLNDDILEGLIKITNNPYFAYDSYIRFLEMYSKVVLQINENIFSNVITKHLTTSKSNERSSINEAIGKAIVSEYKQILSEMDLYIPTDPMEQLWKSIDAVVNSWSSHRATIYRGIINIPENMGTAVSIQHMVFGNMCNRSATGVAFTRDPNTGNASIFGEFLINAQGEDIVSGTSDVYPINIAMKKNKYAAKASMEEMMPHTYDELCKISSILEHRYKNMQDVEFTVEKGKLWILQSRDGKRTAKASFKIAYEMMKEGIISEQEMLLIIDVLSIEHLLHSTIDKTSQHVVATNGLGASPGAVSGKIALTSTSAEKMSKDSNVILVRYETSPEDISGMNVSCGILTVKGGMTSHAAVVARGMGKPCVCGTSDISIDYESKSITVGNNTLYEGDLITIDGSNGAIISGEVKTTIPSPDESFYNVMSVANKFKKLKVMANADTVNDVNIAMNFGADGIGLCRTEHMFFAKDKIVSMQKMILSNNESDKNNAIKELKAFQIDDFKSIFKAVKNMQITIRLLDPPLHEFLPKTNEEIIHFCNSTSYSIQHVKKKIDALHEYNPMLGHRGCRLAMTNPEIYFAQAEAIFIAASEMVDNNIDLEIMIPLVLGEAEVDISRKIINSAKNKVFTQYNIEIPYKLGTMIELPRAALCTHKICKNIDFISFGTNDLTQTTLGISRDDSHSFINSYIGRALDHDPFVTIDKDGVGELMIMAIRGAKNANPKIKIGVCGEHGGDINSIDFFQKIGVDYVSCSPFRIPTAKVTAARNDVITSGILPKKL